MFSITWVLQISEKTERDMEISAYMGRGKSCSEK